MDLHPSKPNPGGVPALRRMFTYAGLLIIVPIFVFAIANYEATPARGVSTVADVVAYQKKAEETLAQIYRYCDHAAEVEERENGDLGYFGRVAFKSKCQRRMLGLETTTATSVFVLATRLPFYFASRWRQEIRTREAVNRALAHAKHPRKLVKSESRSPDKQYGRI